MNTQRLKRAALLPLLASFVLVGCDNTDNRRPASAAPIEKPATPPKIPTTTEEKVQAIQNSPLSQQEKEAAIARVRSGQL